MLYHEKEDLGLIFGIVSNHYARAEEVPQYFEEKNGVEKLLAVFDGVKSDTFYPTLEDKAAYLLLQVNKGHFFSNGNKRLALVVAVAFVAINDKILVDSTKEEYTTRLKSLFPLFDTFDDQADFKPDEFALYNLSIIIADSHKYVGNAGFDELKEKVKIFFVSSLVDWSERYSE